MKFRDDVGLISGWSRRRGSCLDKRTLSWRRLESKKFATLTLSNVHINIARAAISDSAVILLLLSPKDV